ncbi:hypothetical protein [Maritalea sp.]|uniref:hypothetical protein n=1 Tax=Maritalea sp. TaxID=2003361 RepID=UPI003EF1E8D4
MTTTVSSFLNRFWLLLKSDGQNISRDPILLFAIVLSVAPPPLFVAFKTDINSLGNTYFGIEQVATFIAPIVLLIPVFLIGWVVGFLLLEDRDDHMLLAIETTSMGKLGFFTYRLTVAVILGAASTLLASLQIFPNQPIELTLIITLLIALETAIVALTLLSIASNKVEGLALTKLLNIGTLVPLVALIPSTWRFVGGIVPSFWIGEFYFSSGGTPLTTPSIILLAITCHLVWLFLVFRRAISRYEQL